MKQAPRFTCSDARFSLVESFIATSSLSLHPIHTPQVAALLLISVSRTDGFAIVVHMEKYAQLTQRKTDLCMENCGLAHGEKGFHTFLARYQRARQAEQECDVLRDYQQQAVLAIKAQQQFEKECQFVKNALATALETNQPVQLPVSIRTLEPEGRLLKGKLLLPSYQYKTVHPE